MGRGGIKMIINRWRIRHLPKFKTIIATLIDNSTCAIFEKLLTQYRDDSKEIYAIEKDKIIGEYRKLFRKNIWNKLMWKLWRYSR
jgi:hypothetical protein